MLPACQYNNVRPLSLSVSPKSAVLGHVPGTGLHFEVDDYEEVSLSEHNPKNVTLSLLV